MVKSTHNLRLINNPQTPSVIKSRIIDKWSNSGALGTVVDLRRSIAESLAAREDREDRADFQRILTIIKDVTGLEYHHNSMPDTWERKLTVVPPDSLRVIDAVENIKLIKRRVEAEIRDAKSRFSIIAKGTTHERDLLQGYLNLIIINNRAVSGKLQGSKI